jgi:predicted ATP-binding protein involved in virulence
VRLRRLYLRDFKNLRDFEMDFADSLTTVLVGPNGTGKSNVLEALIIIFRDLGSGLIDQSQKATAAATQIAEK